MILKMYLDAINRASINRQAARCAVRAASSGATCGVIGTSRAIRSARADAGGDIAARCSFDG